MEKYKLKEVSHPKERYYEAYFEGDENDSDYVSHIEKYSQTEFDEIVDDLIELSEIMDDDDIQPRDYDGNVNLGSVGYCHTFCEFTIKMYDTDGKVYNVELLCDDEEDSD